jgi:U3 small nucleolar RNA-associated protein 22
LLLSSFSDGSPTDFTKVNAKVCILAVPSSDSPIPLHRLSPSHSNLRVNANLEEQSVHPSSPLYNTALLKTFTPQYHLLATHKLQNDCLAFSDALTLLRIWANQRGYGEGTRMCVRGFEGAGPWWCSVLALLLHGEEPIQGAIKPNMRRSVGKGLSSYQLFKAVLEFLGMLLTYWYSA